VVCDPERRHRLQVFGTGVVRRVFGPKSEEETGGHRRVHKKLRKVYPSHVIDI
jgi:hypothetical protein